jgi:hypothetical protein
MCLNKSPAAIATLQARHGRRKVTWIPVRPARRKGHVVICQTFPSLFMLTSFLESYLPTLMFEPEESAFEHHDDDHDIDMRD